MITHEKRSDKLKVHNDGEAVKAPPIVHLVLAACLACAGASLPAETITFGFETGMITINHLGLALPEVPFGGVKDSGYGSEGGSEAIEAYLNPKFVSQAGL